MPYGEGVDLARALLEQSPVPVVIFGADQRILFVNEPFERVFGWTRAEVFGRPYETLFPPRLREELRGRVAAFLEDPQPVADRPDYTAMRKDGTEFPLQYTATVMDNRHGLWIVVTLFDVSAQRAASDRIASLTRSYRTLARMNEAVVRATDVDALFRETCAVAVAEGGYLAAWVGEPHDGRLHPVADAGALPDFVSGLRVTSDPALDTSHGPSGTAWRTGEPVVMLDFLHDPRTAPWHEDGERLGIRSAASLPLTRAGRTVAVLTLYGDHPHTFDEETADLLLGLAGNVSFALDAMDGHARLEQVSAERERLLHRLVDAQEAERRRIAADLHDEPVQTLAALDMRLGLLEVSARRSGHDSWEQLVTAREVLSVTTASLRDLMFQLEPPDTHGSLAEAIRNAARHVFYELPVELSVDAVDVPLGAAGLGQSLRIVKEALINVRKHAPGSRVRVSVTEVDGGALFRILDDGEGVDVATLQSGRGHRGIQTMTERAELAGGWLRLGASDSGGVEVSFWMPREPATG